MKMIILIVALLVCSVGVCYAEMDTDCYDSCISQKYNSNLSDDAYCKEKCSKNQVDYRAQQIELQKPQLEILTQQLEIQSQSLELQKQSLELQKQQLELQKQQQAQLKPQPKQDAPQEEPQDVSEKQ